MSYLLDKKKPGENLSFASIWCENQHASFIIRASRWGNRISAGWESAYYTISEKAFDINPTLIAMKEKLTCRDNPTYPDGQTANWFKPLKLLRSNFYQQKDERKPACDFGTLARNEFDDLWPFWEIRRGMIVIEGFTDEPAKKTDAVFPNNWSVLMLTGNFILYPMLFAQSSIGEEEKDLIESLMRLQF